MPGLVPGIHADASVPGAWMAGTSPAMTATGAKTESSSGYVEAAWPEADFIIGNPPFLGGNKFKSEIGEEKTDGMRKVYDGRVPPTVDLVGYWIFKATRLLEQSKIQAFGLIATSAIRAGNNLSFLHSLRLQDRFFEVWSDEPWVLDGGTSLEIPRWGRSSTNQFGSHVILVRRIRAR
jgi:hypothetical protein